MSLRATPPCRLPMPASHAVYTALLLHDAPAECYFNDGFTACFMQPRVRCTCICSTAYSGGLKLVSAPVVLNIHSFYLHSISLAGTKPMASKIYRVRHKKYPLLEFFAVFSTKAWNFNAKLAISITTHLRTTNKKCFRLTYRDVPDISFRFRIALK